MILQKTHLFISDTTKKGTLTLFFVVKTSNLGFCLLTNANNSTFRLHNVSEADTGATSPKGRCLIYTVLTEADADIFRYVPEIIHRCRHVKNIQTKRRNQHVVRALYRYIRESKPLTFLQITHEKQEDVSLSNPVKKGVKVNWDDSKPIGHICNIIEHA